MQTLPAGLRRLEELLAGQGPAQVVLRKGPSSPLAANSSTYLEGHVEVAFVAGPRVEDAKRTKSAVPESIRQWGGSANIEDLVDYFAQMRGEFPLLCLAGT